MISTELVQRASYNQDQLIYLFWPDARGVPKLDTNAKVSAVSRFTIDEIAELALCL